MPFGHERSEAEKRKELYNHLSKIEFREFIEVKALMRRDGQLIPAAFTWEDQEIRIEKVLKTQQGSSLKDGIAGTRYLCQALNKRFYLYFTGKQWYMSL